ncbi:hypothetical protein H6G41_07515 [Tolypothrix sp. FACHB-123]|uniref:COG3650 family protein n=1 Tax=Tolypothrix sp. FACHB-123 TaxID=2692868 RepID=UPI001686783E|nr:hypothetical protein [Tolypothrix sp. FACHB-123]MBD2354475.1 hypothetical protein [Tolypothrix sp. FACHB-123]
MKIFISSIAILGLGITLLSIDNNNLVVAQSATSEEFIARGTEPFWSINVSKRGIVYTSPDKPKQTFPYVTPLKADGRTENLVRVYRLSGKGNNLLIIKQVDNCSDGMSDKKYAYSATAILGNRVLDGCAEKK